MNVEYSASFIRAYKKLPKDLKDEVKEKIAAFGDRKNHERLKVHKLSGSLQGRYSFSVNYKFRIVFRYVGKPKEALLLAIGDHDIYQ